MSAAAIRVLVADDHAMVREGIRHVLQESAGFEVVAEAGRGVEALELAEVHQPDVVVMDISMPGESGLEVTARLRQSVPTAKVLILSMHDHAQYVVEALRAGAHGYLLKDAGPAELRKAVRTVFDGEGFFSPPIAGQLSAAFRGERAPQGAGETLDRLTPRERDVLAGVARGSTNKQIGAELGISRRTVETHRESLMRKLDIRTVAGLTRYAMETGLLTESRPPDPAP